MTSRCFRSQVVFAWVLCVLVCHSIACAQSPAMKKVDVKRLFGKSISQITRIIGKKSSRHHSAGVKGKMSEFWVYDIKGMGRVSISQFNGKQDGILVVFDKKETTWQQALTQTGFSTDGVTTEGNLMAPPEQLTLNMVKGIPVGWKVTFDAVGLSIAQPESK